MKISHLLEYPQTVNPNSPLGRAQARARGAADTPGALTQFGTVGQAQADRRAANVPAVVPAAQTAPNTAVAAPQPVNLGAATPADAPAAQVPAKATPNSVIPSTNNLMPTNMTANPNRPAPAATGKPKTDWKGKGKAAADLAGKAVKAIPGMAGAASDFVGNTAQAVAPGLNKTISATGDVGTNLAQNVGNVASAVGSGATKAIGATLGGFGHGYHTARQGKSFRDAAGGLPGVPSGGQGYQGDTYQGGYTNAGTPTSSGTDRPGIGSSLRQAAGVGGGQGGGAGGTDAISDLKSRLGRVEKAMGIAEARTPVAELRPHVRRRGA